MSPDPNHRSCGDPTARYLTEREREVMLHKTAGETTGTVARLLACSPKTVEVHARSVRRKLHLRFAQMQPERHGKLIRYPL